jgi:deaminated glutathione amidase
MQSDIQAAAIQLNASGTRHQNVAKALQMVTEAAAAGAQLIVLPELFNGYGDLGPVIQQAEPIPGPTSERLRRCAEEHSIWLVAGSVCEKSHDPQRGYNTCLFFAPDGSLLSRYRKLYLFEANVPGNASVCESDHMLCGDDVVTVSTELATFGLAICYDLRFPELFRQMSTRGMEVLLFPSAFTYATGKDHWHILLRARAIENQCFVVAANQCGQHTDKLKSYGHSLIIDPWGRILAEAGEEETVIYARLDGIRLKSVREVLPALKNRRL